MDHYGQTPQKPPISICPPPPLLFSKLWDRRVEKLGKFTLKYTSPVAASQLWLCNQ